VRRLVVVVLLLCLVVAGSGVVVALGLLGGDSPSGDVSTPAALAPTPAPDPGSHRPPSRALARFYAQHVTWEHCRDSDTLECGTVTVPLDYARPQGRTIDLAVLKNPAADPDQRLGSLVVNPGGPGAPGADYAAQAGLAFTDPVRDHYDVVGFDPRGTGDSSPVDCLSDQDLDSFVASDPSPDTAEEQQEYLRWVRRFGAGCEQLSGAVAAHVSTVEAARDMDVIRAALGESKLDYFGASYGTKLGATYAELFPRKVGRFVLDGAVDLSIDKRTESLQQAAGFETALRAYVENCVQTTDACFLGDSVDAGLQRIQDFLDQVDASPLPTSEGRELTIGNAFYGVALPLYVRDYWILLSSALKSAFDGDGTQLLRLSDIYVGRDPDGAYANNSQEALSVINCLDDPSSITAAQVPAAEQQFEQASPTFGDSFAWSLTGCSGLHDRASEKPPVVDAAGAAPIVVIGTTRDPATPLVWAEHLADQLDSGVLIRREGDGHTGYNAGNPCVDSAVEDYLVDGTVPEDGLTCPDPDSGG
jgi:pimeloyl-ACP methyl ester carboxylesterase